MYTVKVKDERGRDRVFACGTIDQVLDRLDTFTADEAASARVVDPARQEWTASKFRAKFGV